MTHVAVHEAPGNPRNHPDARVVEVEDVGVVASVVVVDVVVVAIAMAATLISTPIASTLDCILLLCRRA